MFCKCLSFAPYAPYPFIRPALNLATVCIVERVNCSYKQLALSIQFLHGNCSKFVPLPFPWFLPCRLAVLASARGVALTWHSGLVLSIKATLVKPPFSADSDIMRAFIIVSDTLIKG